MTLSPPPGRRPLTAGLLLAMAFLSLAAHGQDEAAAACPEPALAPTLTAVPDRSGEPAIVYAETLDARADGAGRASGQVELFRADQYLSTDQVLFDPRDRRVTFPGPVRYEDSQIRIEAAEGRLSFIEESGAFSGVDFGLVGSSAHGEADAVSVSGGTRSLLDGIWFTTCPGDDPEWLLTAEKLELQHDEGTGVARNASLRLGKVPVLWVPWISFPIDDRRKSGFLYPFLGTANDNGIEFGIPWYWNIAPNQDATLTPRYFTNRGFMASAEHRWLTPWTRSIVTGDYLFDDDRTGDDRWRLTGEVTAPLGPRWRAYGHLERVSDDRYFQDFGGSLAQTSRQFLRSDAGIDGAGRYWIFSAMVDHFQVLDEAVSPAREPYRRLPRIAFTLDAPLGRSGFIASLDSELVYFDRKTGVTGARADLDPSLVWNVERYWGFLRASGGDRYTTYALDLGDEPGDESPDRGTGIVSLDSGLYFDRVGANGDTQTLEPRLFYLYVPFEAQDDLPDFDTGDLTFGFAQLFHYNRFTGADRQGDANQLTLAATTRSISARNGRESWNLSLGQILYLDNPRVRLDDDGVGDVNTSPFLAELNWHPLDRFSGHLELQWNWEEQEMDVGVVGADYRFGGGHRVAAEYRYRRDRLDQVDLRYLWPVNEHWRLFSRINYSLEDSDLLEGLIGAEYDSCCWALRVAARRYLRDRQGGERDTVYVELRLKGLGAFGRREPPLFYTPAP
ncbi:MAG: LPS assembly protein LptD [Gammaproteobacteria bacterium]